MDVDPVTDSTCTELMLINSTYQFDGNPFPLCVDVTVNCRGTLHLSRETVVVLQCYIYGEYCKYI